MNFNNVEFEKAIGTDAQLEDPDLPEICFSGRSNVGKSSLINKILGRKSLARVSTKPGKTVTVNFYRLEDIRLADLPGYGFARVSHSEKIRWSKLMESYFQNGRDISLVIQLVDMRHKPSEDDFGMLDFLCQTDYNFVVVLTKSDKLNVSERAKRLSEIEKELEFLPPEIEVIPFSSVTGEGVERIRELICEVSDGAKKGED